MDLTHELVFDLLRISTGNQKSLTHVYSDKQWKDALIIANEQAIAGVLTMAMEAIPDKALLPSKPVLYQWIGNEQIIEQNTVKLERVGHAAIKFFRRKGSPCCIIKGSAVGQYYPQPYRRSSGDVDIWLDGGREKIYEFARSFDKKGALYGVTYHHVHFHLVEGVHIEVHIWPSYLSSPIRNIRLHKFCNLHRPSMASDKPSLAFDRVFILLHCYRHMCGHGVGLRQVMDYFYVLKQGFTVEEKAESVYWIQKLGMLHFAGGIMWVLQRYFGLEEKFLLIPVAEREGRFIIQELMRTGNMGRSDTRNWGSVRSPASRFFFNLRRDFFLAKHYPHEALWQPIFSVWLYFWRMSRGYIKNRE